MDNELITQIQADLPDTQAQSQVLDASDITDDKTDTQSLIEQSPENDTLSQLQQLRLEVERLKGELEQKAAEEQRTHAQLAEIEEFRNIFPEADVTSLPDDVAQIMSTGNSLAAAYALYLQKQLMRQNKAKQVNERNAYSSSGKIGGSAVEYFTPAEVRSMSQSEVRANYKKIRESMKKWN